MCTPSNNSSKLKDMIIKLNAQTTALSILETLTFLTQRFPSKVCFSTSFGQEDQMITDIIFTNKLPIAVFTLDTGRLFQETYDVYQQTVSKYRQPILSYFPDPEALEKLLLEKGPNSFYNSISDRKECCHIRKVGPLARALKGNKIWVTGLRSGQSKVRSSIEKFELADNASTIKYNPLCGGSLCEVESYLELHGVPQNSLHKKGFVSIGCLPCTRPISNREDARAGRWSWENGHKECGLHNR